MPVGFGKHAIKSMARPLSVMVHLKQSIVEVKSEENCLAHALIIAISRVDKDPNYKTYRQGRKVRPLVRNQLETTGIDLSNGAGNPDLVRFQEHFRDYKIVVYHGLSCEDLMLEGPVESAKRLNLLYDVERHYHVITNLTGAMAKKYVCKASHKACTSEITYVCDKTCSDCMVSPPCAFSDVRIPCAECNTHFRSRTCYDNHKQRTIKKRSVCEPKRCCATCGLLVTHGNHECNKRLCEN